MKEVLHETVLSDYREPDLAAADEATLKAAKAPTEGKALLELLAKKTPAGAPGDRTKELIKQLGADDFKTREQAAAALVELGSAAVPLLKRAAKDPDLEVAKRAQECLEKIGDREGDKLVFPALRLVALRRPDGAADALLDCLARTKDEDVQREALAALLLLADDDSKPDPALVKALEDKDPLRRAAAEAVLGKDGGAYLKKPGRRLFLTGVKVPMKFESYTDGKKSMSRETTEVQFFNQLEDSVFARPK
jgi:HEAT repeat protein